MASVTKEYPWFTVSVDTTEGKVLVVEKWRYNWYVAAPYVRWTPTEMQDFHRNVQKQVWAVWSNRAYLSVKGTSEFARRFSKRAIPVYMDVRRVLEGHHWTVNALRGPEGALPVSTTNMVTRTIWIDSNDVEPRLRCLGPVQAACASQLPVAHEFGHTLGNNAVFGRPDEYLKKSAHRADVHSIMNHGVELRNRHFEILLGAIDGVVENTTFRLDRLT